MESIKEIKIICRKPKEDHKNFYRVISFYLTWIFLKLGLNANQVSVFGLLIGVISALFFITNNYLLFIIGALFLFTSILIDYSDGEIARYRKYKNLPDEMFRCYGGFFDSLQNISIPIIFLCMSISFIGYHPLIIGMGFMIALFRLLHTSFFKWLKPIILMLDKNYKSYDYFVIYNKINVKITLLLPFFLIFTSTIDLFFNFGLTFFFWLSFFFIGGFLFLIKIIKIRWIKTKMVKLHERYKY